MYLRFLPFPCLLYGLTGNGYLSFFFFPRSFKIYENASIYCCCQVTSVVSNSMRPHRWQPTRLCCPWDSPGKNNGVGCHFLLQCMEVKSESEIAQLCPTLQEPMDCSPPGSSVHGILQARVLEWGAIAFSALLVPLIFIVNTSEQNVKENKSENTCSFLLIPK